MRGGVLLISIILYFIGTIGGSYYHLLDGIPLVQKIIDLILKATVNFYILRVPVYMMVGYYLAKYSADEKLPKLKTTSKIGIILLYVLAVIALFAERTNAISHELGREYPFFIIGIISASLLFVCTLMIRTDGSKLSSFLGIASGTIYFTHYETKIISREITGISDGWTLWLIAIAIGILVAAVLLRLKGKYNAVRYLI